MIKFLKLSIALSVAAVVFAGCDKDKETAPKSGVDIVAQDGASNPPADATSTSGAVTSTDAGVAATGTDASSAD